MTKRGSLALRRKPSRKNRRSLISTEEDSLYKDSTSKFLYISRVAGILHSFVFEANDSYSELLSNNSLLGWMDDLRFYILFDSISVISGQWEVDDEKVVCNGTPFMVWKILPQAGLKLGTPRSVGQCLTH